ncbi:filamentous hemagglutinin [Helicobacter sp.]|uniref:filamentous hemagglutinin n=1 Tax=Helicobacter sp. TaxID=218 RepID=UPI00258BB624|nr:filamentous hemagglutinin [Helicobacter sp.]MCI7764882.1 filamentous hemagglutinin [Helicobacter sp.]
MPSGGKFVNGTGSIATNGNKMDIAGNNKNNVIAWGGGFNIGKEASVNFTTNQKNYLNLDYTNKASQILGKLNGGTNNIYLVNPSGVLIGKDASINANKFGVSTSPFDNNAIQTFSKDGSFSPVFSANKGDIVNMGTINANEIVLVGNRVTNVENYVDEKGKKQVAFGSFNKKDSLTNTKLEITANHTDLHANRNTIGTIDSINVAAKGNNAKIEVGQSATGWTGVQLGINQNGNNVTTTIYASIKDTEDWSSFTDIINGGNANNINTFKLLKDIDFKDAGAIEPVGNDISNSFSGNFYGNGHTLSNLLINADGKNFAGLFDYINGGSVQDLTIDGLNFQGSALIIGGFAARINNGTFSNIVLNNIGDIVGDFLGNAGGFAGGIIGTTTLSNIVLNNIKNIGAAGRNAGGFAGVIGNGTSNIVLNNIVLNNIENIVGDVVGGFAGQMNNGEFSNIVLNNIENISGGIAVGGFAGRIFNGTFSNIVLNNIENISGGIVGGFAGYIDSGTFSNIVLNKIENINGDTVSGFAGQIDNGTFSNIVLNNIGNISSSNILAGGFAGRIFNGTFSNIVLNNIGDIDGKVAGGFAGTITGTTTLSNIVLNNIGNIGEVVAFSNSGAGGFAGSIVGAVTLSNIVLNNISGISNSNAGGFAGLMSDVTLSNITLNNIENISGDNTAGGFAGQMNNGEFSNIVFNNIGNIIGGNEVGGFAGFMNNGEFSNIVFNNIGNISGGIGSGSNVGGFVGYGSPTSAADIYFYGAMNLSGNTNQNHISHNPTALNLTNTTDLQTIQNHMQNGSTLKNLEYVTGTNGNSYLYMVTNGKIGDANSEITFDNEEYKLLQSGSTLKNLEYVTGTNGNSYLHMVTNGKIGDADSEITFDNEEYKLPKVSNNTTSPTPPSISNGDNLSSVTLVQDDFAVEVLKLIIDDILKQSFEFDLNHLSSLESILDEMDLNNLTTENIQTILMALLVNGDEANKESIKQTLDFYTEFNKGETDGLKSLFETWYKDAKDTYNISMDKHTYLIEKVKEIPNIIAEFKEVQESIEDYNNKVDLSERELKEAINIYEALLEEYKKLLASYDTDDSEFKNVFDTSYNAFQDNLKAFNAQLADYDAMLKDYNNGSVTYEDTLNAYKALTEKYKALINAHNSVKGSAEAYQNKNSTIKGEYANLVNKINALNEAFEVIQDKNYNFTAKHDELVGIKDALNLGKPTNYEGMTGGGFTFNGTLDLLGPKSNTNIPSQNDKPLLGGIDKPNSLDLGEFNSGFNVQLPEVPGNLPNSGDGANKVDVDNNLPTNLSRESLLSSKNSVITLPAQEKEDVITEDERELGRACIVSDNAKTNSPCVAAF